jgi:hypothetical protein
MEQMTEKDYGRILFNQKVARHRFIGVKDIRNGVENIEDYIEVISDVFNIFKVGDWMSYRHDLYSHQDVFRAESVYQDDDDGRYYVNGEYIERLETWFPLKDEIHFFYNEDDKYPSMAKFIDSTVDGKFETDVGNFDRCEPRFGKLPILLSENDI